MGTNSTDLVSGEMMITPVGALEDFVYAAIRAGWFTNKEISGHPDGFKKKAGVGFGVCSESTLSGEQVYKNWLSVPEAVAQQACFVGSSGATVGRLALPR